MAENFERYYAPPARPETRVCAFCDEPSTVALTLVFGRTYIYVCPNHIHQGEQSIYGRRDGKPRASRKQDEQLFPTPRRDKAA